MSHATSSDWERALDESDNPLPLPMTAGHARRARLLIAGYAGFGVLASLLALIVSSSTWFSSSIVALSVVLGVTVVVGGVTGRLANWSEPLAALTDIDSRTVRQAILLGRPVSDLRAKELARHLAKHFLFGSGIRILLDAEIAAIQLLLAMASGDLPALALVVSAGAVGAVLLIVLELRWRRSAQSVS